MAEKVGVSSATKKKSVRRRTERVIWSNIDIKIEDWKDFLDEEHPNVTDEYEQLRLINELNDSYLDDERMNLRIRVGTPIICIADRGLWYGRKPDCRLINSGLISDILSANGDYAKWYSDGHNIKGIEHHHDGTNYTNYYEYRAVKQGVDISKLQSKIYKGEEITRTTLNYYTTSILPYVAKVYGW